MEEKVFPQPAVAGELARFVEARLHTDGQVNIERIKALQAEIARSPANPIYVIVDPRGPGAPGIGRELGRFEGGTLGDPQAFVDFLAAARW
jgi:hypothetical protein